MLRWWRKEKLHKMSKGMKTEEVGHVVCELKISAVVDSDPNKVSVVSGAISPQLGKGRREP